MGYAPVVFRPVLFSSSPLILGLNTGERVRGSYFLDTTKEVDALLKPAFFSRFSLVTSLFFFFLK